MRVRNKTASLDLEPEIVEILVPDQFLQPDKVHCLKLTPMPESFCFPAFPSGGKTDAVNAVQEVQAVRRAAELEHLAFPAENIHILDTGDCAAPELLKRPVESRRVGRIGLVKKIHVSGEARIAILDDSLAADNEVAHPMLPQRLEEFENVPGKGSAAHFRSGRRGRSGGGLWP